MRLLLTIVVLSGITLSGCGRNTDDAKPKAAAPAKVEKLPLETEIARVTLTPQAAQRLGIVVAKIAREKVERRRVFGGDVAIPAGKSIIVSAPVPGTISPPESGEIPWPGQTVQAGASILSLAPLLSPERDVPTPVERVQIANARATLMSALTVAKGDVQRGQAEVDGARIAFDRAEKLLADRAGSARAVDEARAQLNVAVSTSQAAQDRAEQLGQLLTELDVNGTPGHATPLLMTAPQPGVLRSLSVTRGQTVAAGAALFEVADLQLVWIRVPIYVDLLPEVDTQAEARIVGLDGRGSGTPRLVRPIAAPPTADALSTTADLYFVAANPVGDLRPGQRVGVELAMRGAQTALVVPVKAILYDIYGGVWVYIQTAEHVFQRSRALIQFTDTDRAILASGPPEGSLVVTDGAAELFGTEFGAGK